MQNRKVVVTGLGAITPIGNTTEEYWDGLKTGKSGAADITLFDNSCFKVKFGCEVKGLDVLDFIDRKEARKMDRFTHLAIVSTDQAIADAKLDDSVDKERVGVIWGSGIGGFQSLEEQIIDFGARGQDNPNYKFSPFFIPKLISDIAPGHISIKHGFQGPNYTVVSACASSTNAIIDAVHLIQLNKADIIISGGSEAPICKSSIGGFGSMRALSMRNDSPETASRPFDLDRDGFVMGEGAGALVLESEESALKRGAKIYAEVIGSGMSADAHHITSPHPEGLGAYLVMKNALKDANIQPKDVNYINVHGTSTPLGDISEVKAIKKLFGEDIFNINISSTKSMTGHLLGAAGAIESIACIKAIEHGIVPPTINHFTDDPEFDSNINFTFNKAQSKSIEIAISNTFGFGGHNASVIFKKY